VASEDAQAKEVTVPHMLEPDPFVEEESTLGTKEDPKKKLVTQIYASYYYSAALTSKGEVYTWGSGEFGRLGYVDTKKQSFPRILKDLSNHVIVKLSLGYYHAAAVNIKGEVFTWGRGING